MNSPKPEARSNPLLQHAITAYLATLEEALVRQTSRAELLLFRQFMDAFRGHPTRMYEITILDIEAYLSFRIRGRGIDASESACLILRTFFDRLQLYNYIEPRDNPFSHPKARLRMFQRIPAYLRVE